MALDYSKTMMNIPNWVEETLAGWEDKSPCQEFSVAESLRKSGDGHPEMSDEDRKGFFAEWAAFMLSPRSTSQRDGQTYFGPAGFGSPDVGAFDKEVIARWESRAKAAKSHVMRARYSDLVWDLKKSVTGDRPSHEFAQMAIDAYADATMARMYRNEMDGVHWLTRAFRLARSLHDNDRVKRIVSCVFRWYEAEAKPDSIGTWIVPYDLFFEQRGSLAVEQESRVIDDLERMLAITSEAASEERFSPYGATAAAERLAQYYHSRGDKASAQRVIKTYAAACEIAARRANSLHAMMLLQPVIGRLLQEGLTNEAEALQLLSVEKSRGATGELKRVQVESTMKDAEVDELVQELIGTDDLHGALNRVAVYYVPRAGDAREVLEQLKTRAPLLSMMRVVVLRSDGQPAAHPIALLARKS